MPTRTRARKAAACVLCLALTVAACSATAGNERPGGEIQEITITAVDHAFSAPDQAEAGLASITIRNEGHAPHHAQLVRPREGVSIEQLQDALRQGPEAAFPLVIWAGGPSIVDAGGSQTVTIELQAGTYMLLCLVPDLEGVPHLAHGMAAPLEVRETDAERAMPPGADLTVHLLDFAYAFESAVDAGPQVWKIVNDGDVIHEIALIRLGDGATMKDVETFMKSPAGPPPFANVGGLQAIEPGATGWLHLDLTAGNYVALCHIPDPASGVSHQAMGMVMPFTIQ